MTRMGRPDGPPDEFSTLLSIEREPPRLPESQRAQLIARVLASAAPRAERAPWWQQLRLRTWSIGLAFVAFGGLVWAGQAALRGAPEPARQAALAAASSAAASVRARAKAVEIDKDTEMPIPELAAAPPVDSAAPPVDSAAPPVDSAAPPGPHLPAADTKFGATAGDELAALNEARTAQQRGDSAGALRAIMAHEQRFPRTIFAEDREALRVAALGKLGRTSEARARARAFAKRYPRSVFISKLSPWLAD